MLEHRDPGLSVPLYRAADGDDVVAEWKSWARVLRLPLLVAERDGTLREPFDRIGRVRVARPAARRRRRSAIKRAGPRSCCGGKPGRLDRPTRRCIAASARSSRGIDADRCSNASAPMRSASITSAGEQDQARRRGST